MDGQAIRIDPEHTGTYCVGADDTLWLRHPARGDRAGLKRRGSVRTVSWPAGAAQVPWPDDVMIEDGDQFEILDADGRTGARLTFRRVGGRLREETAWLAETVLMGCLEQARTPLREVARSSVPPELYLGGDGGRHAAARRGAPLRVLVQSNIDGQLYCFASSPGDGTVPLFLGDAAGIRIAGHVPLTLPAERLGAAAGGAEVRCYLADRDIGADLPAAIGDRNAGPLPEPLAADLDTVFGAVPMTRIAKASLAIRSE
jgi:hypothetical protein